jgi:hypothetical protein
VAVVIAWVFYRAETLPGALGVLKGMAGLAVGAQPGLAFRAVWNDDLSGFFRAATKTAVLLVALPTVFLSGGLHRWMGPYNPALVDDAPRALPESRWGWRPTPGQVLVCAAMAAVAILRLSEVSEFIYYNF